MLASLFWKLRCITERVPLPVKVNTTYNQFHNIWRLFDVLQIFLSQVKRCAIIIYKHGIYELSHELPTNSRLTLLRNLEISKVPKPHRMAAQPPVPPLKLENPWKPVIQPPPLCATPHQNWSQSQIPRESLSPESLFWFYLAPDPFKLNFSDSFGNLRTFHTALT